MGILYVDDTNLWEGLEEDDDLGARKGDKCGVTIHHQSQDGKGGWMYTDQQQRGQGETEEEDTEMHKLSTLAFSVPTYAGEMERIYRLPTDKADNNIGLFARPDGKSDQHFEQIKDRMKPGHLRLKPGTSLRGQYG